MDTRSLTLTITAALIVSYAPAAGAHLALGNEIGHETLITVREDVVAIDCAVFLNEVAALSEAVEMDANQDGDISVAERDNYFRKAGNTLRDGIQLTIGGKKVPLEIVGDVELSMPFKKLYHFQAKQPKFGMEGLELTFHDANYPDDPGKIEIYIEAGPTVDITYCSLWKDWKEMEKVIEDVDLWGQYFYRDERDVTLRYRPGTGRSDAPEDEALVAAGSASAAEDLPGDAEKVADVGSLALYGAADEGTEQQAAGRNGVGERLRGFIAAKKLTVPAIVLALAISALLGMGHALTPGHGKAIVAAYLIGSHGTIRDAIYLGIIVTLTHTGSVYIIGLLFHLAKHLVPGNYNDWLMGVSGLLIMWIGLWILWTRLKGGPTVDEEGGYAHSHGLPGTRHSQDPAVDSHSGDHNHPHEHVMPTKRRRGGPRMSLTSLGISGGLVPCPDGILVLILALYLGRLFWGFCVIFAFSIGMGAVLVAIGISMVLTKNYLAKATSESTFIKRHPRARRFSGSLFRLLPAGSAIIVSLLGAALIIKALTQAGVITINI